MLRFEIIMWVLRFQSSAEAAFEGGKWGNRPRPRSWGGPVLQAFMNNEKTKFMRQVVKVDLV